MKKIIVLMLASFVFVRIESQAPEDEKPAFPSVNFGLGGGLDYGGIGFRGTLVVSPRFQIFGAAGYNLLDFGVNGGGELRILPFSRLCPYVGAMYGYNAVIKITGGYTFKKVYYGMSFPIGLEVWSRNRMGFFNVELLVPIRTSEFHRDYDRIKSLPGIELRQQLLPVAFSVGYHFVLKSRTLKDKSK